MEAKPTMVPIGAVRLEESLYPRFTEDKVTVSQYAEAMRSGAQFPPLMLDQHGRLVDGLHRLKAYQANGAEKVPAVKIKLADDAAFFRKALKANSHHGHRFTRIDYANMILRGKQLGIESDEIAGLVNITPGFLDEATRDWFARDGFGNMVPLKKSLTHMARRKLTAEQVEANRHLSGQHPHFFVNQILLLVENDLVDSENEKTVAKLVELHDSIGNYLRGLAKRRNGTRQAARAQ